MVAEQYVPCYATLLGGIFWSPDYSMDLEEVPVSKESCFGVSRLPYGRSMKGVLCGTCTGLGELPAVGAVDTTCM